MNDRRTKLEAVFHAATELDSAEERERYLTQACAGDPELRREVDELLTSAEAADAVFQAGREACHVPEAIPAVILTEKPGDKIGRYKLLEQIGEGGMGVVYMAEQEEPVRRKVALKIIKLGMDTRRVVARFEAERQALALMDHPHIAKALDAGVTETGRPYFVMELVQGIPITEFCEANQLSTEARITLFIPVCKAIQSAHQKGIIHRDIKPSNVLVTTHNGTPHPMVIDFGVAKATNQKLTEKTLFTNFATMIGTPAYMSPEQAELSKLDVDTRSDIYSLGVLLYELLTGSTPFPEERLRSVAYREMQRIIVEEEPERPSTRLKKKAVTGAAAPLVTRHSSLATDLDWIVMKCLEKDRDRRYETANGLAADIQRHLNTEPIIARPPNAVYRLQKAIRRNTLAFAAALAVALTLLGGIAATSWQAVRAGRAESAARLQAAEAASAEKRATAEAASSRAVTDFLFDQLFQSHPYESSTTNHAGRLALLEEIAQSIEGKFSDQPLVEERLRVGLGTGLIGFSGSRTNVLRQMEVVAELRRKRLPLSASETLESTGYLALHHVWYGRPDEAERLLAEVAPYLPETGELSQGAAVALAARASLLRAQQRPADAMPLLARAIPVLLRTLGPTDHRNMGFMYMQALCAHDAGETQEAERLWSEGTRHFEEWLNPNHPAVAQFLKGHAYTCLENKRWQEAMPLLERALSIYRRTLPENHSNTLDAEDLLAHAHELKGDIEAAAKIYSRTYPHWIRLFPYIPALSHCRDIATFFLKQQSYQDARAVYEAQRQFWETNPPDNSQGFESLIEATAASQGWLAAAALCQKQFDSFPDTPEIWQRKAWIFRYVGDEEHYQEVVKRALSLPPAVAPFGIAALGYFPFTPEQTNQLDAMMAAWEASLPGLGTNQQAWGYRSIGHLQLKFGRLDKCLEALEKSAVRQVTPDAYNLFIKAICLHRLGRGEEARAAFEQGEAIMNPLIKDPSDLTAGFIPVWQIYEHAVMHREARAALNSDQ